MEKTDGCWDDENVCKIRRKRCLNSIDLVIEIFGFAKGNESSSTMRSKHTL